MTDPDSRLSKVGKQRMIYHAPNDFCIYSREVGKAI